MPRSSEATPRLLFDEHFAALKDPRDPDKVEHSLRNLLLLALAAVLAGERGWDGMALVAAERADDLRDLLDPADGTPCADTFRRVFGVLNPDVFAACLAAWTRALAGALTGEVVAFDGKSHRGTERRCKGQRPLHTLHAWATRQRLLLRHQTVAGAPEEVAGIVATLRLLSVTGTIITTDANGCTREVAQAVRDSQNHYLLALKGNRAALHTAVVAAFTTAGTGGLARGRATDYVWAGGHGHGRTEFRQVWTLPATALGADRAKLPDLTTLVHVVRTRRTAAGLSSEDAYYVTDLRATAKYLGDAIRAHWGVENHLHHSLDVVFGEDRSRVRDKIAADNLGSVRRIADALLRRDTSKMSLTMKSRRAALSSTFLRHLLTLDLDS